MMASFQRADDFLGNHELLADLVIARSENAIDALRQHIASTLALVYPAPERRS
jgi:hypothetical protein